MHQNARTTAPLRVGVCASAKLAIGWERKVSSVTGSRSQHSLSTLKGSNVSRVQMADTHRLVRDLQEALGDYGASFWGRFRPAQLARAVVASPYPLCAVSVGIHISEALLHLGP